MTPLRLRMIHDLQLRGYSDRTVEAYVRAVAQLAQFHHASPDQLGEEQIRHYLLHLSTVQKVARGTHTIALCGITFFSQQTLGQPWPVLDIARPKGEKKLPVVLSRDEVWRVLCRLSPADCVQHQIVPRLRAARISTALGGIPDARLTQKRRRAGCREHCAELVAPQQALRVRQVECH